MADDRDQQCRHTDPDFIGTLMRALLGVLVAIVVLATAADAQISGPDSSGIANVPPNTLSQPYTVSPPVQGAVASLGGITPGSGYTTGTYAQVSLTGGTGHSVSVDLTVNGAGQVSAVTLTGAGSLYVVGDTLTCTSTCLTAIGGTGTGFSVPVASIVTPTSRTLANRGADVINVMDYGAACAGTSGNVGGDDGPAINAAIAAARSIPQVAPGVPVLLQFPPDRLCVVKTTINLTSRPDFDGTSNSAFSAFGFKVQDAHIFCISSGSPCIDAIGAYGVYWENIHIWGDGRDLIEGTSTTSNTVGTGTFTFTTQAGLTYITGTRVLVKEHSNSNNYMLGTVTSYSGATLVISATSSGGSGTFTDWDIWHQAKNEPSTGIQIGRVLGPNGCGGQHFNNVQIDGSYSVTAHYNFACEGNQYTNIYFNNWDTFSPNNYSLIMDGSNHWGCPGNVPAAGCISTLAPGGQREGVDVPASFNGNNFTLGGVQSSRGDHAAIWFSGGGQHRFHNFYSSVGYSTSNQSMSIATGSQTFNIAQGPAGSLWYFQIGQRVRVRANFNLGYGNYMEGAITAVTPSSNGLTGTMTVNVDTTSTPGGAGPYNNWVIYNTAACNVDLYFFSEAYYDNVNQVYWDAHFEANTPHTFCLKGAPGIGATKPVVIDGMHYATDQALQTQDSIFRIDPSSSITSVNLNGLLIDVDNDGASVSPTLLLPKLFDTPSSYNVTGADITLYDNVIWNEPNTFTGKLCMPPLNTAANTSSTFNTTRPTLECQYSNPIESLNRDPDLILDNVLEGQSAISNTLPFGTAFTHINDSWLQFNGGFGASGNVTYQTVKSITPSTSLLPSYLQITGTTQTLTANQYASVVTGVSGPDANQFNMGLSTAKPINFDFCAQTNTPGTYNAALDSNSSIAYPVEFTLPDTNPHCFHYQARYTDAIGIGGLDIRHNAPGFWLEFVLGAGSNLQGTPNQWNIGGSCPTPPCLATAAGQNIYTSGNYLRIGNVHIYPSWFKLPYKPRPLEVEIARASRYFAKSFPAGVRPAQNAGGLPLTLGTLVGGSGYNGGGSGTFFNVPLTGGSGTGLLGTVTVTTGAVTAVAIADSPYGYKVGDSLTASAANLGNNGGSGFSIQVATISYAGAVGAQLPYAQATFGTATIGSVSWQNDMMSASNTGPPVITFYSPGAASANCWNYTKNRDSGAAAAVGFSPRGFTVQCTLVAGDAIGDLLQVHWSAQQTFM